MARPRKQAYTNEMYLKKNRNGDIDNSADTQRNFVWKAEQINGLIRTVLLDEYVPPIILAEEDSTQLHIADGGQRTAALMLFRYGNYKITKNLEDSVIPYKKKIRNEDGTYSFEDATCELKGKTYETLPPELQKTFDEYQIETVIHEHCNSEKTAKYIKIYNQQVSMNNNQKAYTYIYNFACLINKIVENDFFVNHSNFTDNEKTKAVTERTVMESIMCMFHFDKWNKETKSIAQFLNENSNKEEFNALTENLNRLNNVITDKTKVLFNSKDCFIWITLFDKFANYGLDDAEFGRFLEAFINGLKDNEVDGKLFDTVDEIGSTKDKTVVATKLHILETLMREFLHIEETENVTPETFVAEMLDMPVEEVKEDIDLYEESLKDLENNTIKDGSKLLDIANRLSLLAMVAYSYKNDVDLDDWLEEYAANNNTYFMDQRKNYSHMLSDFKQYQKRIAVA